MNTKQIYHDWNADFTIIMSLYRRRPPGHLTASSAGRCEKVCPQHLPIRRLLTEIAAEFEKQ